jgi:hypothetical protein
MTVNGKVASMIQKPYGEIEFVFVSDHYDFHRSGICRHDGKLAQFSCVEDYPPGWGSCGEDCDGCDLCNDYPVVCQIKPLTTAQKIGWIWKKKLFEICVGTHWTYPNRPRGASFRARRPRWLYALLFALYYRNWRSARMVFYRWPKMRSR